VTSIQYRSRRTTTALALAGVLAASVVGCAGQTNLAVEQGEGPFVVELAMDPQTLNPPQLATLNVTIADRETKQPITAFTPVYGALLQNVLISKDLLHFQHSYTGRVSDGALSVLTNFPVTGEYQNHVVFQPQGAEPQHVRSEISTGSAEMRADILPDADIPKLSQGVQHDLLLGPNPLRAGQPAQIALFISEKGQAVTELDTVPPLPGPGLMFVSSQDGEHFAIEQGAAPSRAVAPREFGTPSGVAATPIPTTPATGSTPQSQQQSGAAGELVSPPTLVPDVANALASVTARPVATLIPVQQTAMASVLETPAVVPSISFGPYVAFTHTFPEAGLYKLWFKTSYRQRVMLVDYVVRVE
jgi:hypothetical protein